jgi:hypothetical protein
MSQKTKNEMEIKIEKILKIVLILKNEKSILTKYPIFNFKWALFTNANS